MCAVVERTGVKIMSYALVRWITLIGKLKYEDPAPPPDPAAAADPALALPTPALSLRVERRLAPTGDVASRRSLSVPGGIHPAAIQ